MNLNDFPISNRVILVTATQRSGTTLLRSFLAASSLCHDYAEVFHHAITDNNFFKFRAGLPQIKVPSQESQIKIIEKYLYFLLEKTHQSFALIDVKYNSYHHTNPVWHSPLECPLLIRHFKFLNIPIIHVVRKNLLETECSLILSHIRQKSHLRKGEVVDRQKININLNTIISRLEKREYEIDLFNSFVSEYKRGITIYYDEMIDDTGNLSEVAKNKLEEVTSTSIPDKVSTSLMKISPPLDLLIGNFDEVKRVISKSRFSYLLENELG